MSLLKMNFTKKKSLRLMKIVTRSLAILIGITSCISYPAMAMEEKYYSSLNFTELQEKDYNFKKEAIYRVATEEKKISLTFDVNWADEEQLYKILDILDKHNVKATFFIMGRWIVYPDNENVDKLKEIHKRGHEIGNHSYSHADFKNINEQKMIKEIKDAEKIIEDTIGVKTELFRFPSGHYNENGVRVANSLGYRPIQWDVDSIDWKQLGLDREYNRVIKNLKPGSILLFHNNGKYTPENLERLIPEIQSKGYEFVTVDQLLYKDGFYIDSEGVQRLKKE